MPPDRPAETDPRGAVLTTDHDRAHLERWARTAARAADAKLGTDIVVIDVGEVLAITDLFVVATGRNPRQVRTIADEVEKAIKDDGGPGPVRVEGRDDLRWVLLDFGGLVVHVFVEEARSYYELERLWSDRPRLDWAPAEQRG